MNNKKGFTLIELLVVIALMLSILIISIVSFVNTSNRKKKDAWNEIKKEIETAAVEYFNTNEYLFEDLTNSTAYISVGKLVDEDYINSVSNPVTGKKIDYCSLVSVIKNKDKLTASYDEVTSNEKCNSNYMLYIEELGGPKGTIKYYKEDNEIATTNNNGWFNISSLGENKKIKICIKADTNNNGPIISASISGNKATKDENGEFCIDKEEDGIHNLEASLVNASGKRWKQAFSVKKDTQKPEGIINAFSNSKSYNSNVTNINVNVKDNLKRFSKIIINNKSYSNFTDEGVKDGYDKVLTQNNFKLSNSLDGKTYQINAKIYDEAGNEGKANKKYKVYLDCQESNLETTGSWYNKKGATCSNKCGGTIDQEINTRDKNSKNVCSQKKTRKANCGGLKLAKTVLKDCGECSKTCGGGTKTCKKYNYYVSTIDESKSCGKKEVGTRSKSCNTNSCVSISKISADTTYCSLRNPWGYSKKKYNEEIKGNNCRDTSNNPRIILSNIKASLSGKKATINVTLDIYSTSWEMLATSSNSNNARKICVADSDKFSASDCVSNSVEIKSKSSTWNSYSHVLDSKTVTLTISDVSKYSKLSLIVYSPGHGVKHNPTCTHSSGYNCVSSTGAPFIFQSAYLFEVKS